MRVVRIYRINSERAPLSLFLFSSYPVLRDPLRVSHTRMCMSCRLGFGRHGSLMNGGCRLHARETPEKIFKFVFTSPPTPAFPSGQFNPCCTLPRSAHRFVTPSFTSLRHSTPRQMNAQIHPT